jgi:hypothetical protein
MSDHQQKSDSSQTSDDDPLAPPFPYREDLLEQLAEICQSALFEKQTTLKKLLKHLVQSTLDERKVTERSIGREVFARGADFDPTIDPYVRVQKGKLAGLLEEYYASEGETTGVHISIKKYAIAARYHQPGLASRKIFFERPLIYSVNSERPPVLYYGVPIDSDGRILVPPLLLHWLNMFYPRKLMFARSPIGLAHRIYPLQVWDLLGTTSHRSNPEVGVPIEIDDDGQFHFAEAVDRLKASFSNFNPDRVSVRPNAASSPIRRALGEFKAAPVRLWLRNNHVGICYSSEFGREMRSDAGIAPSQPPNPSAKNSGALLEEASANHMAVIQQLRETIDRLTRKLQHLAE